MQGEAGLPEPECLPNDDCDVPYFVIGDDAFGLRSWMMKPHPSRGLTKEKRIFNYMLSRAQKVANTSLLIISLTFCLTITLKYMILCSY